MTLESITAFFLSIMNQLDAVRYETTLLRTIAASLVLLLIGRSSASGRAGRYYSMVKSRVDGLVKR